VVAINLISALLSPIISLFFVLHLGMGATGRILGLLLASGAVAIAMVFHRVKNGIKPGTTHTSYLLKNSLPLIPSILARATMGWSDKLIIKSYLGVIELAKYSVAHTVGMALFGIIGSLSSAMNPWIIRKLSAGRRDLISPVIKNLTELISFGAVFIIGLAPEILSFLAPRGYLDSLFVIIPFAVSTVPYFLFSVSSVIITFSEKTKLISLAASAGAAVNLILNLFFISELGSVGGALSYLVAELLIFLLALKLLGTADTSLKEEMKRPFPLVFAACSAAVLSLLYRSLAIRLLLLIIPACLAVNRVFACLSLVREKNA
jgi:O-antigen/teichoic acid export membrane protein